MSSAPRVRKNLNQEAIIICGKVVPIDKTRLANGMPRPCHYCRYHDFFVDNFRWENKTWCSYCIGEHLYEDSDEE